MAKRHSPSVTTDRRPSARRGAPFPPGFLWGVATAAYQIEGAADEDGRGPSVWDAFCAEPGRVFEGHTGAVACDHYHRVREDVALMRRLGVRSYRFSVSWPRVLPRGTGRVNAKGLDFYDRLVDQLARAGIEPLCTLFHWDFPLALQRRGGWQDRDAAGWFADYAAVVARRLSDRVRRWVTINEPSVYVGHGHADGTHAPGEPLGLRAQLAVAHNSLRAHGRAVQALRAHGRGALVGYALAATVARPLTERAADVAAAKEAMFAVEGRDTWGNSWWLDPVVRGAYPADGLARMGKAMPAGFEADLPEIRQPLDFIGLNIYTATTWRQGPRGAPERIPVPPGFPRSAVPWQPIVPSALYWGPRFFHERAGLPLYITESGLSTRDWVFLDGKVHDPHRVDYLRRVLLELARALREGVPVEGYYHWSLLDNFEWAEGYKERFGLVYVDFQTQERVPKDSFELYRKVIASDGRALLGKTAVPPDRLTP